MCELMTCFISKVVKNASAFINIKYAYASSPNPYVIRQRKSRKTNMQREQEKQDETASHLGHFLGMVLFLLYINPICLY